MRSLFFVIALAAPAAAQELVFDPGATATCVEAQETEAAALECVGRAAQACMELTEGGYTTVGMTGCVAAEWRWWDEALNAAYRAALDEAKAADAENAEYGITAPPLEANLRDMQRAWIAYRDGLCAFEMSKWGGGTGGGPANVACLMNETARQTLILQRGIGLE